MPEMSSGLVSTRTSTTGPSWAIFSACSAVRAIRPVAAPGPAFRPLVSSWPSLRRRSFSFGSKTGASSCERLSASMRFRAVWLSMRPSSTKSMAMRMPAMAVRLPLRVCSR